MPCQWAKEGLCQIIIRHPNGEPLTCDGHHSSCFGLAGKVRDKRDTLSIHHPNFPSPDYPPGKPGMAILRRKPPPKLSWARYNQQISHQIKEGDQLSLPNFMPTIK